jgi:hypothetical protein
MTFDHGPKPQAVTLAKGPTFQSETTHESTRAINLENNRILIHPTSSEKIHIFL